MLIDNIMKEIGDYLPEWAAGSKPFVPGITPIYYSGPFYSHEEIKIAITAFLTGKWLVTGEYVNKFQVQFSKKFNVKYSHMVNSGSSANLILITALKKYFKWDDGDEIIVSPVGFPTTIAPIAQNQLTPVFVDIEFATLNFNVNDIEKKITSRTKAIFVSPVLGNPPNMDILQDIAKRHNILLIGDNCDSLGTKWNGQLITDLYFAWTTSFYPAHHITTGEGGMISSNDEDFINLCQSLSWWGRDCYCVGAANLLPCGTCKKRFDKWIPGYDEVVDHKYVFTSMGYNLKPLDLQGALGLAQLRKFDTIDKLRKEHYQYIVEQIKTKCATALVYDEAEPSWFGVPLICESKQQKQTLQQHFESNKIQTRNYFAGNILMHEGYKHLADYQLYPNANKAMNRVFFIGCPPHYTQEMLQYIGDVCQKA